MRVTRIERQKRRRNRHNIYLDGRFALGVSDETLLRTGLRTGDEIDATLLKSIGETEQASAAMASALLLISYRARSVHEIEDRLRRKGYETKEIQNVVADLRKSGMLDDRQFARMFLRDQLKSRPAGPGYLRQKLRLLGIPTELADDAIDEIMALSPEAELAARAARKYLRTGKNRKVDPDRLRNRLSAYLARRGFSWESIRTILGNLSRGKSSMESDEQNSV